MPIYVSASSRLLSLLTALGNLHPGRSLRYGWSQVLDLPEDQVQFSRSLHDVAALVSQACDEARRAEKHVALPLQEQHFSVWGGPIYATGKNLDAPINHFPVPPDALYYLQSVACVLQRHESHDVLPEGDELAQLIGQVADLFDAVNASQELPSDVKPVLLRRISQLRYAIENSRSGGAEAVHEAADALLGGLVLRHKKIHHTILQRVGPVVAAAYLLFSAGPTVRDSLEAWPEVLDTLTAITQGDQDRVASSDAGSGR